MSGPGGTSAKKPRGFPIRLDAVVVLIVLLSALLGFWNETDGGLLAEGAPAPAFEFDRHGGGRVLSLELGGKVVVLDFWATWCPPCVEEMPWLARLGTELADQGVIFLAVSHDEPMERQRAVSDFLRARVPPLAPFVVYGDPLIGRNYGVQALPTLYVLGKDGRVLHRARGAVSEAKVRRWVEEALAK